MLDRIARQCARGWRVFATGAMIVEFALHTLWTVSAVLPWIRFTAPNERERERAARRATAGVCGRAVRMGEALGVLRLHVEGADRLRGGGLIVVANHPTMIDALVLLSRVDDGVCVTQNHHWDKPVMRRAILESGFPFSNDGIGVVDSCVEHVENGASLVLFPEGTRSPERGLHPLKRAAAHMALRSGRDLLPVVIRCEPRFFAKGAPWYRPSEGPREMHVRVLEPIRVAELLQSGLPRPVAVRRITSQLNEILEKHLERARA